MILQMLLSTNSSLHRCVMMQTTQTILKGGTSVARRNSRRALQITSTSYTTTPANNKPLVVPVEVISIPQQCDFVVRQPQRNFGSVVFFVALLAAIAGPSVLETNCDDAASNAITGSSSTTSNDNPLWPTGISTQTVNDFVDDILKDPSINISAIPDYVERIIYKSTVRLTLNMVYSALSNLHGMEMLAHKIQLHRYEEPHTEGMEEEHLRLMRGSAGIDEHILEQVADRLLANKAVNQRFLPDFIERQLYVNCLKLVFRVLDTIAATFRITVCGHDMRLFFEPSTISRLDGGEVLIKAAESSATKIDIEAIRAFARNAGVNEIADNDMSFLQRMLDPTHNEFVAQLHASLYALILGIVDDLLANTELELLSDRIRLDILPNSDWLLQKEHHQSIGELAHVRKEKVNTQKEFPILAPFAIGIGVGIMLMSFAGRK